MAALYGANFSISSAYSCGVARPFVNLELLEFIVSFVAVCDDILRSLCALVSFVFVIFISMYVCIVYVYVYSVCV